MIDARAIYSALESYALELGHFAAVNRREPKSAPALGENMLMIFESGELRPSQISSGLSIVSYRWEILARIYSTDDLPGDIMEPRLLTAASAFMTALAGGFTLGGLIKQIDIFGSDGEQLSAKWGWAEFDSGSSYRTCDIIIPCVINDVSDLES